MRLKQRITIEQLEELTEKQKIKLREWWKPETGDYIYLFDNKEDDWFDVGEHLCTYVYTYKTGVTAICVGGGGTGASYNKEVCLPLLSIGQTIELLGNRWYWDIFEVFYGSIMTRDEYAEIELCDALWEEVKKVL